jgi:nitroreductase
MELFEAIEKRACVRKFAPVEIPDAHLERIVDAGRRAPSGKNIQPVSYIVIKSKDTIQKLAKVQACVGEASAAIAVVTDPAQSAFWLEDACAATENMCLAVTALGYHTVWVQGTLSRQEDFAKELLGIPKSLRLLVLLPVGKPADAVAPRSKRPLAEVLHHERW